ncbi:hypothetical protein O3P69_014387 [Scylla paramamosain]|uniref:Ionotropic glutamate receptor C-terminal domain-containing protein n=1 Tax=Scylla paramamosain TaxID=85552 RepID=A0AAW0TBY1_SCYPA
MVAVALLTWLFFLSTQSLRSAALLRQSSESTAPEELAAVQGVWASQRQHQCPALLLSDNPSQVALTFVKEAEEKLSPRGIVVFLVTPQHRQGNGTLVYLKATIDKVRQMGGAWHCLLVVVVSDDAAFFTAFAHLSLRHHALRWSTRILVLTRLPLSHLGGLHGLLSTRNAMLLLAHQDQKTRFPSAPTLTVAVELMPHHSLTWVDDPLAAEGRRLHYTGAMAKIVGYLAEGVNFTCRFVLSPDRTFGTMLSDGSWTGMIGMVVREQGETSGTVRGPSCRRLPCLLKVSVLSGSSSRALMKNTSNSASLTPNADVVWPAEWWWWERLVLGLWMLTTLVLTRSYAGNLMSLLAVRYVPQPFQTPRDVLNDPHVAMIWQKYSKNEHFLRTVESGVFREVAELEEKGRLKFLTQAQFQESLDTLVRSGHHVLVDNGNAVRNLVALDFSQKGRCDFYQSRDGFLPFSSSVISQKTHPIIHGFNPRVMSLTESGLLKYWAEDVPNFTRCNNVPKTVALSNTLSFSSLWGVFVLLASGLTAGLVVWCLELLNSLAKKSS